MDLQGDEPFRSEILFICILEVGACHSIEPGLDAFAVALDDDSVPVVPLETFLAPDGELLSGVAVTLPGKLPRIEPATSGFVVDACRVGAVPVIVVFALVAEDPAVAVALLGAELAS